MRKCEHSILFESYGVTILVDSNSEEAIKIIRSRLDRLLPRSYRIRPDGTPDHHFSLVWNKSGRDTLYKQGEIFYARVPRDEQFRRLDSLIRLTVAEFAVDHVFIHAGVVVWKGRAIVMPGRSLQGKSTLTEALVRQGATYYSDEYAVINREGRVFPFLKALSRRVEGKRDQEDVPLGLDAAPSKLVGVEIGLVLFTAYSPGSKWEPIHLSPAKGIFELIKDVITMRHDPVFSMEVLRTVGRSSLFVKTERAEAGETAGLILQMLDLTFGESTISHIE